MKQIMTNNIYTIGQIYPSALEELDFWYKENPELAGKLAIAIIEHSLCGEHNCFDTDNEPFNRAAEKYITELPTHNPFTKDEKENLQIDKIASLYNMGYTQKAIAVELNVSEATISRRIAEGRKRCPELFIKNK